MSVTCPISHRRVDTQMVRAVSVLITITALLYLFTSETFFVYLLAGDFTLRLFRLNAYSPFFQLASAVLRLLHIRPRMSDEAPKRFALYLGWGMSVAIALFALLHATHFAQFFIAVLLLCAAMEMFFEYCIGCKIYQYLQHFKAGR